MDASSDRRGSFGRPTYPPAPADINYPPPPPGGTDSQPETRPGQPADDPYFGGRFRASLSTGDGRPVSRMGSRISDMADSELEEMERIVQMEEDNKKLKKSQDRLRRLVRKKNLKIEHCEKMIEDMKSYGIFRRMGHVNAWKTELTECLKDREICMKGCFLPCWLFGENYLQVVNWDETPGHNIISSCACCKGTDVDPPEHGRHRLRLATGCCIHAALGGFVSFLGVLLFPITLSPCYTYELRTKIRQKYNLVEAPYEDFFVSCMCHQLALCQEAREIQARINEQEGNKLREELKQQLLSQGVEKSDGKPQREEEKGGSSDEEDVDLHEGDAASNRPIVTTFNQNPPQVQRMKA